MRFDEKADEFELSTGRRFYANNGVLGVSADHEVWDRLELFEGFDGTVFAEEFTTEERREVAEYMIALWREFGGLSDA